ncbi:hypothetical protein [Lacrimispora xylanisolvens]
MMEKEEIIRNILKSLLPMMDKKGIGPADWRYCRLSGISEDG